MININLCFSLLDGDSGDELNATADCIPNRLEGCAKYWFGKDYTNFIVKDFNNLELPYQGIKLNYSVVFSAICLL